MRLYAGEEGGQRLSMAGGVCEGGDMSGYHFHKDCKHFPECTEELTRNQGHEVIKFTCPAGGVGYYYKGDLHSIKWDCGAYEPMQMDITDFPGGTT